jgi:hypothetical protein
LLTFSTETATGALDSVAAGVVAGWRVVVDKVDER